MTKLALIRNAHVEFDGVDHVFQQELPGDALLFIDAKSGVHSLSTDPETGDRRLPTRLDLELLLAEEKFKPLFMAPARNQDAEDAEVDLDIEGILKMDAGAARRQWWVRA